MFAHLRPLESLRSVAPVLLEIAVGRHTELPGEESDDALGDVASWLGETAVELKGFQQNGEVEPRGSALAEQIVLVRGQQPMPGQLLRVLILLHAYKDGARSGCSQRSILRTSRRILGHATPQTRFRAP